MSTARHPGTTDESVLGIAELARRAGVTPRLVRAWESRYGFPHPQRTPSGQRRYDARDVERIVQVLALKDAGSRLSQAIARVQQEEVPGRHLSVYGELRRRLPHLESRRLRRGALVGISHAIEDEALARAVRPLVLGAFQREELYLRSAPRWVELARTAAACLVYADFAGVTSGETGPVRVPVDPASPLLREWAVVVLSAELSVVLAAWELPGHESLPRSDRSFETIFSFDPEAVRLAAEACLAAGRAGSVDADVLRDARDVVEGSRPAPGGGTDALVLRAFDYLQRAPGPARTAH